MCLTPGWTFGVTITYANPEAGLLAGSLLSLDPEKFLVQEATFPLCGHVPRPQIPRTNHTQKNPSRPGRRGWSLHQRVGDLQVVVGAPLAELQLQLLAERVGGRRPEAAAQASRAAQQAPKNRRSCRAEAPEACARLGASLGPPPMGGRRHTGCGSAGGGRAGPARERSARSHAQNHTGPVPASIGRRPLHEQQIQAPSSPIPPRTRPQPGRQWRRRLATWSAALTRVPP